MKSLKPLRNKKFITTLFWKNRKKIDSRIHKIVSVSINKIKFYEDKNFHHAVINYKLKFYDNVGWLQYLSIYVSAHSNGSRARSFKFMNYIYNHGFGVDNYYASTKPLFYYPPLKASFHLDLIGENLVYIIREKPKLLMPALRESGNCLAHFHKIPFPKKIKLRNFAFNRHHLDPSQIMLSHQKKFADEIMLINTAFSQLKKFYHRQKKIFSQYVFSHGDFHLENVIIGTNFKYRALPFKKIGIIDYTDICQADRGLDLGTFINKIEFLTNYKLSYQAKHIANLQAAFLKSYFKTSRLKPNDALTQSIAFWKTWNNLKVMVNYMLFPQKKEAMALLKKLLEKYINDLNIGQ